MKLTTEEIEERLRAIAPHLKELELDGSAIEHLIALTFLDMLEEIKNEEVIVKFKNVTSREKYEETQLQLQL